MCSELLIVVNYGHNHTVEFNERGGESLVKVCQSQSNLIDGSVTAGLGEIHILI